jgi:transposase-like protein
MICPKCKYQFKTGNRKRQKVVAYYLRERKKGKHSKLIVMNIKDRFSVSRDTVYRWVRSIT